MVGNQSSGKSSVLEAIVGLEIFPKGTNMVTKRPLELAMLRDPNMTSGFKAQFGSTGRMITQLSDIRDELADRNAGDLTDEPIYLTITSPHVHNLTVIDLPGLIRVTKLGEDDEMPDKIRDMCLKYIRNPVFIKLIVMGATNDRANSMGLEEVKKAGQFHNSFGVLTKLDIVAQMSTKHDVLKTMLTDKEYLPGLGMVGVMLRSANDIETGVTINDAILRESKFIRQHNLHDDPDINVSVPHLVEILSREQLSRIASSFPDIIDQIDQKIVTENQHKDLIVQLSERTDLSIISSKVNDIVTLLHPLSPTRMEFESLLEQGIGDLVKSEVLKSSSLPNTIIEKHFISEYVAHSDDHDLGYERMTNSFTLNAVRKSYDKAYSETAADTSVLEFNKMTMFGDSDPNIGNKQLSILTGSVFLKNCTLPFYR